VQNHEDVKQQNISIPRRRPCSLPRRVCRTAVTV